MAIAVDSLGKDMVEQGPVLEPSTGSAIIQAPEMVPQPWVRHRATQALQIPVQLLFFYVLYLPICLCM